MAEFVTEVRGTVMTAVGLGLHSPKWKSTDRDALWLQGHGSPLTPRGVHRREARVKRSDFRALVQAIATASPSTPVGTDRVGPRHARSRGETERTVRGRVLDVDSWCRRVVASAFRSGVQAWSTSRPRVPWLLVSRGNIRRWIHLSANSGASGAAL